MAQARPQPLPAARRCSSQGAPPCPARWGQSATGRARICKSAQWRRPRSARRLPASASLQHRPQPHHLEIISIHHAGRNGARRAQSNNREIDLRECAQLRNGLQPRAEVVNFGDRESGIRNADSRHALPNIKQLALILIGQRPQQHRAHHAEVAALAPMPRASVSAMVIHSAGTRASDRNAIFKSRRKDIAEASNRGIEEKFILL